jgi:hypothetical protein
VTDNTLGTKSNQVSVNIGHVHMGTEPPEPGISPVIIDGTPIHALHYIKIEAQVGLPTTCIICFECEVSGKISGKPVEQVLAEMRK